MVINALLGPMNYPKKSLKSNLIFINLTLASSALLIDAILARFHKDIAIWYNIRSAVRFKNIRKYL